MEGGPPTFGQGFTGPALLKDRIDFLPVRGRHPLWPAFPDGSGSIDTTTGLIRVRSPLLAESRLVSFPPATEMFQFAGFASRAYVFSARYRICGGLPHSEIRGSTIARISPRLFAACYVLHRLSVPRHPPNALRRLIALSLTTRRQKPARGPQRLRVPSILGPGHRPKGQKPRPKIEVMCCVISTMSTNPPIPRKKPARETGKPCFQSLRSKHPPPASLGGGERNRTVDLLLAKQALSQLSYTPGQGSGIRDQGSE